MDLFSEAEEILTSSSSRKAPLDRRAHVATFAFLMGAGRQAGDNETVLAIKDSDELARFFSKRYLKEDALSPPPSISSSCLLIHGKSGKDFTVNNSKGSLQQLAVLNMSSKFYTTPDSVFYTPRTILENVMSSMEELIESRLKSTLLQLVEKLKSADGGVHQHMKLLLRLISPSKNPLRISTVLTQFVSSEDDDRVIDAESNLVQLALEFKATIDVQIFNESKTVELLAPVSISAKFDSSDNLLSAIDIKFECDVLLNSMITNSRLLVNDLMKRAAALSISVAKYLEKQSASALAVAHSIHSLGSIPSASCCSISSNIFSSFSSPYVREQSDNAKGQSYGLRRTAFPKRKSAAEFQRVNEEFDLTRNKKNDSVVRFNVPSPLERISSETVKAKQSGNIHRGLFNWIQDDEMFLTEEKIREQNAINEEEERKAREAPMPRRFFTATEEIDLFCGRTKKENRSRSVDENGQRKKMKL